MAPVGFRRSPPTRRRPRPGYRHDGQRVHDLRADRHPALRRDHRGHHDHGRRDDLGRRNDRPHLASSRSGPPPSGGELTDQGWTVGSTQFSADPAGIFQGTARITNTTARSRSAGFTFTLFQGETLLASLISFGTEIPAGDTVTVSLISIDPYVDAEYSIDFQVDYTF